MNPGDTTAHDDALHAFIMECNADPVPGIARLKLAWPDIREALPRFLLGPNDRLQDVCHVMSYLLEFTDRWDELLALALHAEARAVDAGDYFHAGLRAIDAGYCHNFRRRPGAVLACADRAEAHFRTTSTQDGDYAAIYHLRAGAHASKGNHTAAAEARSEAEEYSSGPDSQIPGQNDPQTPSP